MKGNGSEMVSKSITVNTLLDNVKRTLENLIEISTTLLLIRNFYDNYLWLHNEYDHSLCHHKLGNQRFV